MIVDITVVLFFLIFGAFGYARGFVRSALAMIKVSISVILSILLAKPVASRLNNWFQIVESEDNLKLYAVTALIIFALIRLLLIVLNKIVSGAREKNKTVNAIDRWLGFVFGLLRACFLAVIASLIIYILSMIPFTKGLYDWIFDDSKVALWVYKIIKDLVLTKALAAILTLIS